MNKIFVIIFAIMLVVASIFFIPLGSSSEIESGFGFWNVSIFVESKNGNTHELHIPRTYGAQLLAVYRGGQEITSITYILSARATGAGFTGAELDMSDFYIGAFVSGNLLERKKGTSSNMLSLDGEFIEVFTFTSSDIIDQINDMDNGSHVLVFGHESGSYKYRGVPGGEWQESTTFPESFVDVTVVKQTTCFRCDGQGGFEHMYSSESSCPPGWIHSDFFDPESCECTTEYSYDPWSDWLFVECSSNCHALQQRTQKVYTITICPGFIGPPARIYSHTVTENRIVYDANCCQTIYITCYKCDGLGGLLSEVFENSCPSGWVAIPPDCSCYDDYWYGPWTDWDFLYCIQSMKFERREREVRKATICPGFIGPPYYAFYETQSQLRYLYDPIFCNLFLTFVFTGSVFSINNPVVESYRMSETHYLGRGL
jgi:hypothetical protein